MTFTFESIQNAVTFEVSVKSAVWWTFSNQENITASTHRVEEKATLNSAFSLLLLVSCLLFPFEPDVRSYIKPEIL
jgi:hypothetical protein